MDQVRAFYADKRGIHPERRTEPRLREELTARGGESGLCLTAIRHQRFCTSSAQPEDAVDAPTRSPASSLTQPGPVPEALVGPLGEHTEVGRRGVVRGTA